MRAPVDLLVVSLLIVAAGLSQAETSSERIDRIKAEAHRKHPGDAAAGAKEANRALEAELQSATGPRSQGEVAAFAFLGYYTKNVSSYQRVCSEYGVRMTAYPSRFAELHAPLLRAAAKYADTTKIIESNQAGALQRAREELSRLAQSRQSTLPATCTLVEENAEAVAEDASFKKVMPLYHAELSKKK